MSAAPLIRELRPADLAPLCAVLCRLPLLQRYGHTPAGLAERLRAAGERGERLLVAETTGPIGLGWFSRDGTLGVGGYLRLIAVAEPARGTGAALLAAFEREVFAASAHAFLLVSDFNQDAQRFYERHGYQRVGALPGLVLADVSELIYWKRRPASAADSSG